MGGKNFGMIDPALAFCYMYQMKKENEENNSTPTSLAASAADVSSVPKTLQTDNPALSTYDTFPRLSMDPYAYGSMRYEPVSVDDPAGMQIKLDDFVNNNNQISQSLTDRFTGDYYNTYHIDAEEFAKTLNDSYKEQKNIAAYLINDIEAYREIMGDAWADETRSGINAAVDSLYQNAQAANADAEYWAQFESSADYGAAMFDANMHEKYGRYGFDALQQAAEENNQIIQNTMSPSILNHIAEENDWLLGYAASIATADDYEKLKKETEDTYSALSELYNDGDTSDENVRIFDEMQSLQQDIGVLDELITAQKDQEYYEGMASGLEDLPEQLQEDVLNIPYLEDEKIKIIENGMSDHASELAVDNIILQKSDIKLQLKELGYTNKEINGFIIYAELLHDKQAYEAAMQEKQAYAEEHPVAASAGSVMGSSLGLLENFDSGWQKLRNILRGEYIPVNEYDPVDQMTDGADVTRDTVAGMIEVSTGSRLLSRLYDSGMTGVDIAAQLLATGGTSAVKNLATGLGAAAKALGDDFVRAFIKNYGDDAVRALATYGDDAVRALVPSGDDALKIISGNLADDMVDDWYGAAKNNIDDAADDWDEVISHALAGDTETGYNGSTTEGAGESLNFKSWDDFSGYIQDVGKDTTFTIGEKVSIIQKAYVGVADKTDINIPIDAMYVKGFTADGKVEYDWPKYLGFDKATITSISRNNLLPETWDRYGSMNGSNFSDVPSGGRYKYSERSTPYVENENAYHSGSFNNDTYFDKIDAIRTGNLGALNDILESEGILELDAMEFEDLCEDYADFIAKIAKEIGTYVDAAYGLKGKVAAWRDLKGGAGQITLPLIGDKLTRLGIII